MRIVTLRIALIKLRVLNKVTFKTLATILSFEILASGLFLIFVRSQKGRNTVLKIILFFKFKVSTKAETLQGISEQACPFVILLLV